MKGYNLSLLILLFIASFFFHMIGLNKMGRTWDEQYKVDNGYIAWDRLFAFDFSLASWQEGSEHPMVAKYLYGFFLRPHLIRLDDGNGHIANLPITTQFQLQNQNYIPTILYDKLYAVSYDFTFPRVVSAILNSLAVALTAVLAAYIMKSYWIACVFLLLSPRFVAMGQLMTYESISVFLFTLIAVFFHKLLKNPENTRLYIWVAVLCGLIFWTRYNNVVIFPFLAGWMVIDYLHFKNKKIFNWRLILIPSIAFVLGFVIWPLLWHNFPHNLINTFAQHNIRNIGPSFYFVEQLIVTTPIPILLGFAFGVFYAVRQKSYYGNILIWWALFVLLFYTIFSVTGGGVRYIIVILPAVAILAAYGITRLFKDYAYYAVLVSAVFILFEFLNVHPYYLDYYNQIVGGPAGAARSGYAFSWWGEGQREAGLWINNNVENGASVGYIVTPKYVVPKLRNGIENKGYVDFTSDADYLMVSRTDFRDMPPDFSKRYTLIYAVNVQDEPLVSVFRAISTASPSAEPLVE